jgi:hypothetical protein
MSKRMRRMAGKVIRILTGRQFLTMVGLALVSSAVSYASSTPRDCRGRPRCRR